MLKHVVMHKYKTIEQAQEIANMWKKIKEKISCVITSEVGENITGLSGDYDIILMLELKDEQALQEYLTHPYHKEIKKVVSKYKKQRACVDYYTS